MQTHDFRYEQGVQKTKQTFKKNYKHTEELNLMKLRPGLEASYAIQPKNGAGLFYSSPNPHSNGAIKLIIRDIYIYTCVSSQFWNWDEIGY